MRIVFSSCSNIARQKNRYLPFSPVPLPPIFDRPVDNCQPVWKKIQDENPDIFMMLGDNIYGGDFRTIRHRFKERYQWQVNEINFKALRESVIQFFATWDDQDFHSNNANGAVIDPDEKKDSRKMFHDYMDCSTNRPHVYCSKRISLRTGGPIPRELKIIMLDGRYYREPASSDASLLGEEQEEWLENELKDPGFITMICCGNTFSIANSPGYASANRGSWVYYPAWCERFFYMVKEVPRLLYLGGSIHRNAFDLHPRRVYQVVTGENGEENVLLSPGYLNPQFFEVISSAVGLNYNDWFHTPRDNYAVIDIGDEKVNIQFKGARQRNRFSKVIDIESWTLDQ